MKGSEIFSIKAISKKVKGKELGTVSTIYNNLYYMFKRGATGINAPLIDATIKVIKEDSEALILSLEELKGSKRKPRTTKKKVA